MPKPTRGQLDEVEADLEDEKQIKEEVAWNAKDQADLAKWKRLHEQSTQETIVIVQQIRDDEDAEDTETYLEYDERAGYGDGSGEP